jgi:hypothetical protein
MSSAQPDALLAFANALSAMVDELSPRLQQMGAEALAYQLKPHPGGPDLSEYAYGTDPATRTAAQMVALADRVRRIGAAFRVTDDFAISSPAAGPRHIRTADADLDAAIDRLAAPPVFRDQPPLADRLVAVATGGELAPYPPGAATAGGYHGGGAIVGPDGRTYPLAVPYVAEDGVVYTADEHPRRDGLGVLDGADRGWQVVATELGTSDLPDADGSRTSSAYTVVYEQHPDGRTRAELTVHTPPGGDQGASATNGSSGRDAVAGLARHAVFANGVLVPIAMRVRAQKKVAS